MDPLTTFSRSKAPIYAQVASLLKERISSGEWGPGDRLPNLEALQAEFGIARVTARQAIELLKDEGLVWGKQGKGTFVATTVPDQRWLRVGTDWASLMSTLEGTTIEILEKGYVRSPPAVAESDGRLAGRYRHLKRVHSHSDRPFCVISLHIADDLYAAAPEDFDTKLAMQVIPRLWDEGKTSVGSARQSLVITRCDIENADHLGIEIGAPVAVVKRVMADDSGRAIYFAEIVYRGDYIKLDFDLLAQKTK